MNREISFIEIPMLIAACMEKIAYRANPNVSEILETEAEVYDYIESRW